MNYSTLLQIILLKTLLLLNIQCTQFSLQFLYITQHFVYNKVHKY